MGFFTDIWYVWVCVGLLIIIGIVSSIYAASKERQCPFCLEIIPKAAIVCKHCKRDVPKM